MQARRAGSATRRGRPGRRALAVRDVRVAGVEPAGLAPRAGEGQPWRRRRESHEPGADGAAAARHVHGRRLQRLEDDLRGRRPAAEVVAEGAAARVVRVRAERDVRDGARAALRRAGPEAPLAAAVLAVADLERRPLAVEHHDDLLPVALVAAPDRPRRRRRNAPEVVGVEEPVAEDDPLARRDRAPVRRRVPVQRRVARDRGGARLRIAGRDVEVAARVRRGCQEALHRRRAVCLAPGVHEHRRVAREELLRRRGRDRDRGEEGGCEHGR